MEERLKQMIMHAIIALIMLAFARLTIFTGWAIVFTMVACINMAFIIHHAIKD